MTFNLDDYVDVAERIRLFYGLYPDGRLVTTRWGVEQAGDKLFVYCEAEAHKTPDDPQPCSGTAWEPIPGATPYTRDSELMNAETAAWGRAIIAAGIPSKKIASRQEAEARQPAPAGSAAAAELDKPAPVTPKQHALIGVLVKKLNEAGGEGADWVGYSRQWVSDKFGKTSRADLTSTEAGKLIDHLEAQLKELGEPF